MTAALRSKQVRAARAVGTGLTYAEAGAIVGRSKRTVTRWLQDPDLRAIADREGALPGELGPLEILSAALVATKASGQPDWPTRLSAARAIAALPPEEDKPEPEDPPRPEIIVYDLPPGADPVLHRAANKTEPAATPAETPSEQPPPSETHAFFYQPADGEGATIGTWSPPPLGQSAPGFVRAVMHTTSNRETAERWRAELAAGTLPEPTEDAP